MHLSSYLIAPDISVPYLLLNGSMTFCLHSAFLLSFCFSVTRKNKFLWLLLHLRICGDFHSWVGCLYRGLAAHVTSYALYRSLRQTSFLVLSLEKLMVICRIFLNFFLVNDLPDLATKHLQPLVYLLFRMTLIICTK